MSIYYFGGKKVSQSEYATKTRAKYKSPSYKAAQLKSRGISVKYEGADVTGVVDKRTRSQAVSDLAKTGSTLPIEKQQEVEKARAAQEQQLMRQAIASGDYRSTQNPFERQQIQQRSYGLSGNQMLMAAGITPMPSAYEMLQSRPEIAIDKRTGRPYGNITEAPKQKGWLTRLKDYSQRQQFKTQFRSKRAFAGKFSAASFGASVVVGFATPIRHPIQYAKGFYEMVRHPVKSAAAMRQEAAVNPSGFAGEMAGQALFFKGAGAVLKRAPIPKPSYETIKLPSNQKFSKYQGLSKGEVKAGQVEFHHTDYVKGTGKKLTIGEHELWHDIDTGKIKANTPELKKFYKENKIKAQPEKTYTAYRGVAIGEKTIVGIYDGKLRVGTKTIKLPEGRYGADVFQSKAQTAIFKKSLSEQFPNIGQQFKDIYAPAKLGENVRSSYKAKNLPKPEFFSEKQAQVVLDFGRKTGSPVRQYYGSSAQYAQTPKGVWEKYMGKGTLPKDYDIQLDIGTEAATPYIKALTKKLQKTPGFKVRLSKENPLLIETKVKGEWHHAADIHSTDMPKAQSDIFSSGEYAYGLKQSQASTKIGVMPAQRLSEQGVRKFSSIATLEVKGKTARLYPEAHRVKDIGGYFAAQEQLARSKWFGKKDYFAAIEKAKEYYTKELTQLSKSNTPFEIEAYAPKSRSPYRYPASARNVMAGVSAAILGSPSARPSSRSPSLPKIVFPSPYPYSKSPSKSLSPSPSPFGSPSKSPSRPKSPSRSPSLPKYPSISPYKLPSPSPSPYSYISPRPSPYSTPYYPPSKKLPSPVIPYRKELKFDSGKGKRKNRGFKKGYAPSLTALLLNIKGKAPKQKTFSGLELRPIVTGKQVKIDPFGLLSRKRKRSVLL